MHGNRTSFSHSRTAIKPFVSFGISANEGTQTARRQRTRARSIKLADRHVGLSGMHFTMPYAPLCTQPVPIARVSTTDLYRCGFSGFGGFTVLVATKNSFSCRRTLGTARLWRVVRRRLLFLMGEWTTLENLDCL